MAPLATLTRRTFYHARNKLEYKNPEYTVLLLLDASERKSPITYVMVDAHRSWRKVKVTDRRANQDFAICMRDLADVDYHHADKIRVVMDNLSTHTASAIYQTFPAAEARRILRRLEFHYTPRHASWLNMAEIEIGVMRRQCLTAASIVAPCSKPRSAPGSAAAPQAEPKSAGCSPQIRPE